MSKTAGNWLLLARAEGRSFHVIGKTGEGLSVPHPLWACVWTGYQVSETGDGHFCPPSTIVAEALPPRNVEQFT